MANSFGTDILIQAEDPAVAASFYVGLLGFEITDETPEMISLHGEHVNLFIERGPALGPVLEVTVDNVEEAKLQLVRDGCEVVKDDPDRPRTYVKDRFGLIYNLTTKYSRRRLRRSQGATSKRNDVRLRNADGLVRCDIRLP